LPEEKRRGITIELGFAELPLGDVRLGIVDVPGHERFVRTMLAGATGIDLAMLVVAADDSIKPQTREHLDILRLLDLEAGVIALTKCDLVDGDWLELVEAEIRELVRPTFLADAPIVRTSTMTGQGIDELKRELALAAARVAAQRSHAESHAPFRMAVDRSFSLAGHGTVVTGSVSSGTARVGDELVVEPGEIRVRVRSLHNHDRPVEEVHRGQRAACNLAGVHHDALGRGQLLASPGHLQASRLITAQLKTVDDAGTIAPAIKNRSRVRLHVGTAEVMSVVRLLDRDRLEAGQSGPAQLFLSEPVAVVWGQPLVVRSESPVATIGGGHVLDASAEKIRRPDEEVLQLLGDLASGDSKARAAAALFFAGLRPWKPEDLARLAGIDNGADLCAELVARGDLIEMTISPSRRVSLHRRVYERLADRISGVLKKMHDREPLRVALDRSRLMHLLEWLGDDALVSAILGRMRDERRIRLEAATVALEGAGPKLSANEQKLLAQLVERFRTAGIESPSVQECRELAVRNQASVPQLLKLAAASGELVEIAPEYFLHREVEMGLRDTLRERMADGTGMTVSQIREILGTTRKYAVPICEYLDQIGYTVREGDLRVLANQRAREAAS
jgi:selenocysteine-specific elongation factor